jgi:hypothetical protein
MDDLKPDEIVSIEANDNRMKVRSVDHSRGIAICTWRFRGVNHEASFLISDLRRRVPPD